MSSLLNCNFHQFFKLFLRAKLVVHVSDRVCSSKWGLLLISLLFHCQQGQSSKTNRRNKSPLTSRKKSAPLYQVVFCKNADYHSPQLVDLPAHNATVFNCWYNIFSCILIGFFPPKWFWCQFTKMLIWVITQQLKCKDLKNL